MPADQSPQTVRIKKYPNRRYYDATHSRHVTLEDIHQMIVDGHDIAVTDSKTGQDITAKVLAQVIIELDPLKLGVFPADMLHRVIRSNEQIMTDFVEKYFNQALSSFVEGRKAWEQYLRQSMGLAGGGPAMPGMDWFRTAAGTSRPPADDSDLQATVKALQEQVAVLQARAQRPRTRNATKKSTKKRPRP